MLLYMLQYMYLWYFIAKSHIIMLKHLYLQSTADGSY